MLQSMRHDKKDGSVEKDGGKTTKEADKAATKALAEQAEAAKSINQLSKQELEDLLKKVRDGEITCQMRLFWTLWRR